MDNGFWLQPRKGCRPLFLARLCLGGTFPGPTLPLLRPKRAITLVVVMLWARLGAFAVSELPKEGCVLMVLHHQFLRVVSGGLEGPCMRMEGLYVIDKLSAGFSVRPQVCLTTSPDLSIGYFWGAFPVAVRFAGAFIWECQLYHLPYGSSDCFDVVCTGPSQRFISRVAAMSAVADSEMTCRNHLKHICSKIENKLNDTTV